MMMIFMNNQFLDVSIEMISPFEYDCILTIGIVKRITKKTVFSLKSPISLTDLCSTSQPCTHDLKPEKNLFQTVACSHQFQPHLFIACKWLTLFVKRFKT